MNRFKIVLAAAGAALVFAAVAYASATDTVYGTGAMPAPGGGSASNSAFGYDALHANSNGSANTAVGFEAVSSNTGGSANTGIGSNALDATTIGQYNTAVGSSALETNITGSSNTAVGEAALFTNKADNGTAVGLGALQNSTTGATNTAVGFHAMFDNTTGQNNVAIGGGALALNTTGSANVAIGLNAGVDPNGNVTGSSNTFLGTSASPGTDTALTNATAIGANAIVSQSDSVVIGAPNTNVGLGIEQPKSKFQIGTGATGSYGTYLQVPVVVSTVGPPLGQCTAPDGVGRLVIQEKNKKLTLWGCNSLGKWVKL